MNLASVPEKTGHALRITPTGFHAPVADKLPEVVERLVANLRPKRIILFGSYAYGKPTPDSDVDLLVILETDASTTERYLAVSGLLYPRPFPVDILVRTPHEIDEALHTGDFFIQEIITQGRVLYERSN
jgi:predicted nucleotidyltransferase